MNKVIFHIDFNSYFATVEQQANPRLRGKPVGVTGGDRMKRTVLGAASIEAKKFGVKTGMQIWEAKKLCPQIILVPGDSDKYLETTKRFLNILKDYSPARLPETGTVGQAGGPYLEVFSIDEVFLQLPFSVIPRVDPSTRGNLTLRKIATLPSVARNDILCIAQEIKSRVRAEIGEWISCSIGISYNKLVAKLAGSLYKPDGLVVIADEEAARFVLDRVELDEICGIGSRIKKRLHNMGIFDFAALRKVPLQALLASFKSYGQTLYNMARGIDDSPVTPFYEKAEVKSVGHRHTIDHDTADAAEIKQILLKLTELIARRLRSKNLVGKTVSCWYRLAYTDPRGSARNFNPAGRIFEDMFQGDGMQTTVPFTNDGLQIFKAGWKIFNQMWDGGKIRMVGVSVSNLKPQNPQNLSLLPETCRQDKILRAIDSINDKYGEFTLKRAILLGSSEIRRKPNPFLADRRFKL